MMNNDRTIWTDELIEEQIMSVASTFDPVRMPSRSELEEHFGNSSLTNKIAKTGGFYHWANKLNLSIKKSDTKLGIQAEEYVKRVLSHYGYCVELTPIKYPYDLLVDGCVKIDVKAANVSYANGFKMRSYRIAKRQQTCDFYILCEVDGDQFSNLYVVPSAKLTGQIQVGMGDASKAYEKYKNRLDLIRMTEEFYKSIE